MSPMRQPTSGAASTIARASQPDAPAGPSIVIIGGGFSGTVTAVHLLRRLGPGGRVAIVNRSGPMARGLAYGTRSDRHVLNVTAGQMSALESEPDSFVRFCRAQGLDVDRGAFVSRHVYGAYLEWLLNEVAAHADAATLDRLDTEVTHIEPATDGTHALVALKDGTSIRADRIVLAVGNYPPQPPLASEEFFQTSRRYVADPWGRDAFADVDARGPILLMGTGLTMIDIALELHTRTGARCIALSRRGLVPHAHVVAHAHVPHAQAPAEPSTLAQDLLAGPASIRAYVRTVRRHVRDAASRGVDWRVVLAALRAATPQLWRALPLDERRRFLRHVRSFWDVHRHRMAPDASHAFARLRSTGAVTVVAGRIVSLRERDGYVLVRFRPRGANEWRAMKVAAVVNCLGPASDTRVLQDVLFDGLRHRGLICPDPLGLGIETTATGAIVDAHGTASPTLYYVGPFLRARDWEATAVPELRRHACALAEHLLATLAVTQP